MIRTNIFYAAIAASALVMAPRALSAQDRPQRVDTTVDVGRRGTLSVSIFSGRVNVTGTSGSTARITGTVERGVLDVRSTGSGVAIETDPEAPLSGRVELDISVPIGTRVELEGQSAPFTVRGVKGEVKLESIDGDIQVSDAVDRVDIETVSGDVTVSQVDGNVHLEAVNGTVTVTGVNGDISAESVSGGLSVAHSTSKSVRAETVAGAVSYIGAFDPSGNYSFKTHAGRLTLGVPANTGATVSLETFSGQVDSDFPVTLESGRSRMGHESKFEFRLGDGRSRVLIETFSGDIRIQRSN